MLVYNIGFKNSEGEVDETQLDVNEYNSFNDELVELFNLILSLKDELDIQEIIYIDCVNEEEEE